MNNWKESSEEIFEFKKEKELESPLRSCIEFLQAHKNEFQNDDVPHVLGSGDKVFQISDERIFKLPDCNEPKRIGFVDGGNAPVLKSADFCICLNRVAGALFNENKYEQLSQMPEVIEFYSVTILTRKVSGPVQFVTKLFPREEHHARYLPKMDIVIPLMDTVTFRGKVGFLPKIEKFASIARRFAEWTYGREFIAQEMKEDEIFVRDGSLQTGQAGESILATQLYEKAIETGVIVTGLSKTCRLFTNRGDSLISVIDSLASNKYPKSPWYYHPIYKITRVDNQADLYFVKLHPHSPFPFRFDIYIKQSESITQKEREHVISNLMNNSKDLSFPGYPHGLIKVDQLSRVAYRELDTHKILLLSEFSDEHHEKYILPRLHSIEAHDLLNKIRKN